jgi:hypothetical protein
MRPRRRCVYCKANVRGRLPGDIALAMGVPLIAVFLYFVLWLLGR